MAKKKKKKKQHRFFWFMIRLQIVLMLLVVAGMAYYFLGGYADDIQTLKDEALKLVAESDEKTFIPARASSLYDVDNNLISELRSEKDSKYVRYEDIPAYFSTAMVSIEDKKFYKHNGIDYKAMIRAAKAIIQDGRISQGGSTITMQLARNIYLDTGKNWQRKVKEMFIAIELEKIYSKNKIMEFYLNNINFSNGYYGVEAACHGYFNCELNELDLSQIAFLCAIPNSPTYYDPLVNMDHTLERRDRILKNMYEDGRIDENSYKQAVAEEIVLNVPQATKTVKNNSVDTYAYYCATRALMENAGFTFKYYFDSEEEEKEYDEEYDDLYSYYQKQLYSEGYKIYTSIDMTKQVELQNSVDTVLGDFTETDDDGVYKMQGAAVSIDNETGYVVAIVGSRSQDFPGYTLNRAYQSHRQPGSSIKPLIVYTPAFESGYDPDSKVNDHKFEGGPSNASNVYYGNVTIRTAVAKSLNTVAWQLYDEITPNVGLQYLKNMNFSNIVDSDYVTATSLGGFTTGVSPLEMASAYATLENDGIYRSPTCVKAIIDSDENIVYTSSMLEQIVYSETSSRMMVSCMEDVMKSGTGRSIKLSSMPCAGKTGTTNDHKDGWFCGFTRYYTTCVWVGYDIPKKVDNLTGSSYPGKIWKMYMESIHENLKKMDFLPYAQLSSDFNKNDEENEDDKTNETDESEDDGESINDDNSNADGNDANAEDTADNNADASNDNSDNNNSNNNNNPSSDDGANATDDANDQATGDGTGNDSAAEGGAADDGAADDGAADDGATADDGAADDGTANGEATDGGANSNGDGGGNTVDPRDYDNGGGTLN